MFLFYDFFWVSQFVFCMPVVKYMLSNFFTNMKFLRFFVNLLQIVFLMMETFL